LRDAPRILKTPGPSLNPTLGVMNTPSITGTVRVRPVVVLAVVVVLVVGTTPTNMLVPSAICSL